MSVSLTNVCPLCNFFFRILYLTSTSIGKRDEHYDAHSRAAWHCTPAAKAHRRARCTHKNAANRHEAHAQSNPIGADFHNSVAQQHRTEAKAHRGYKSIYSALSSEHNISSFAVYFFWVVQAKKSEKKQQSHKFNSPRPFSRKATLSANHSIRNLYVNSRNFYRFVPN